MMLKPVRNQSEPAAPAEVLSPARAALAAHFEHINDLHRQRDEAQRPIAALTSQVEAGRAAKARLDALLAEEAAAMTAWAAGDRTEPAPGPRPEREQLEREAREASAKAQAAETSLPGFVAKLRPLEHALHAASEATDGLALQVVLEEALQMGGEFTTHCIHSEVIAARMREAMAFLLSARREGRPETVISLAQIAAITSRRLGPTDDACRQYRERWRALFAALKGDPRATW
jgi:hypothetical protein